MCNTCGCNISPGNRHLVQYGGKLAKTADGKNAITVLHSLLSENDRQAAHNRQHFDHHGVLAINLMSAPGAGKTRLLEATIDALKSRYQVAVIEGDLETENDANRIRAKAVTAVQICTGNACHLDAHMLHDALGQLALDQYDIVFIENVGNLVCPASFDLGHHRNVTLLSVTEGDDKPAKYPVMFRATDLLLLSKVDLLPLLEDFDINKAEQNLRQLANSAPVIQFSATTQTGMDEWVQWLDHAIHLHRRNIANGKTVTPNTHTNAVHRSTQQQAQLHDAAQV